jgi:hypothetical protein
MVEHLVNRLGQTVAGHLLVEEAQRAACPAHHPMPLAIAIQFWKGDQSRAVRLARFLADLEPHRRSDVLLVFARRFDVPMSRELVAAEMYCGRKFTVSHAQSKRKETGHPDGCFGLWAGTADEMYVHYLAGWPCHSVFFVEAEGVPMRWDWIDEIKRCHAENLAAGKRVTGARMEAGLNYSAHINGSMVMHLSCWADHTSLHECRRGQAWDVFHSQVLLQEAGHRRGVLNLYGAHKVTMSVFKTLGRDHAWLASMKDGSAWKCAQSLLKSDPKLARQLQKYLRRKAA